MTSRAPDKDDKDANYKGASSEGATRKDADGKDAHGEDRTGEGAHMPLTGHLQELRHRLIKSLGAVAICFVFTYALSESLYALLTAPLIPALPEESRFMAFTGVAEPFFTYLKVGFFGAVFVASPVILHQGWAFIAPALYEKERRWFLPVVCASLVLFITGVVFAYLVVLPLAFTYLMGYAGPELKPVLSMSLYLSISTKLLMAFGVSFQLPLVMLVLARIGVVDSAWFLGWWRYALVLSVVFGALLTPPDVVSQVLLAVPVMALYGVGVVLAKAFGKKKKEEGEG